MKWRQPPILASKDLSSPVNILEITGNEIPSLLCMQYQQHRSCSLPYQHHHHHHHQTDNLLGPATCWELDWAPSTSNHNMAQEITVHRMYVDLPTLPASKGQSQQVSWRSSNSHILITVPPEKDSEVTLNNRVTWDVFTGHCKSNGFKKLHE